MTRKLLLYLIVFPGLSKGYPVFSASIKECAMLIDGEGIVVNGRPTRLHGIDLPDEAYGRVALKCRGIGGLESDLCLQHPVKVVQNYR